MPSLVPESNEIAVHKAEIEAQVDAKVGAVMHWEHELKRIDPSLSLVVAKPGSEDMGLLPGRWHVVKTIPGAPDEYWPLVGPNDEYREPGGWILDEFTANDLWDSRVHRDKKETKRRLREARTRAKELAREQRADEMMLSYDASQRMRSEAGFEKRTDLKGHASRSSKARKYAPKEP